MYFDLEMVILFCFDHSNPSESFYQWASLFLYLEWKSCFHGNIYQQRHQFWLEKHSFYFPTISVSYYVFYRKKYPKTIISLFLPFNPWWRPAVAKFGTIPTGIPLSACLLTYVDVCWLRWWTWQEGDPQTLPHLLAHIANYSVMVG